MGKKLRPPPPPPPPPPPRRNLVKNRTIFTGDNLHVMRGLESGSVDLVYLDPPFNSKHNYAAPIGSKAAGAAFKDTWTLDDVDEAWWGEIADARPGLYNMLEAARVTAGKSMMSYLIYMAVRIIEMRRVLKNTGSLYLHCDPTASHYLKVVLDSVFGRRRYNNEVVWKRTSSHNRAGRWGPVHDVILYYSASSTKTWNRTLRPLDQTYRDSAYKKDDKRGRYMADNLTGPGTRTGSTGRPWGGVDPGGRGRHWELPPDRALPGWFSFPGSWSKMTAQQRLDELDRQGLIYRGRDGSGMPRFKRYLLLSSGKPIQDVITDISPINSSSKESLDYPTQKPLALLERIIGASSNRGDVVLDPFCGCATACSAAERLDREWIGIDISPKAYDLINYRLKCEAGLDRFTKGAGRVIHRTDIPRREGVTRTRDIKHVLYGRQAGNCNGCGTHFEYRHLEVDHIIPRDKGGQEDDENKQLLCGHCNRIKGARLDMAGLKAELKRLGLITRRRRPRSRAPAG